jgi:hypothetical protein
LATVLGEITSRLGDLLVRRSSRQKPQDLDLALCETRRSLPPARDPMPGGAEDSLDHVRFKTPGASFRPEFSRRAIKH